LFSFSAVCSRYPLQCRAQARYLMVSFEASNPHGYLCCLRLKGVGCICPKGMAFRISGSFA
jgi:hypothetical protein